MAEAPAQPPYTADDRLALDLEICYEVLLYLSSRMARLGPGEVLEFITGDLTADAKLPIWCEMRGYTLLEHRELPDGRWRFLIQK